VEVIGFDTEYHSDTSELLSWQVSVGKDRSWFFDARRHPLTPFALKQFADATVGPCARYIFVSYFSLAELQFLPVFDEADIFFRGPRGSLDAGFMVDGVRVEIVDVARWFDGRGLRDAAEAFGLKKLEWNTTRVTRATLARPGFADYAVHDAWLARELFLRLRTSFAEEGADITRTKTPAGTASRVFRARYLEEDVRQPPVDVQGLALRCAWGGRAEAYVRGRLPYVEEWDISSAYPNAIISFGEFPRGEDWKETTNETQLHTSRGGMARVHFSFDRRVNYPCLPVFDGTYLLFPSTGESFCTFDELNLALDLGAKVNVLRAFHFDGGIDAPQRYMRDLVARREGATGAKKVALKLLANSWTGKLIQNVETTNLNRMVQVAWKYGLTLRELGEMTDNERNAFLAAREAPGADYDACAEHIELGSLWYPSWYALLTGRVRGWLGRALADHGAAYSATDALWTPKKLDSLPRFKRVRGGPATVVRSKLAAIWGELADLHVVHHSIPSPLVALELLLGFDGSAERAVEYSIRRPIKVMEALRHGKQLGKWVVWPRRAETFWDGKRELLADGKTTRPWRHVSDRLATRAARARAVAGDDR